MFNSMFMPHIIYVWKGLEKDKAEGSRNAETKKIFQVAGEAYEALFLLLQAL